MAFLKLNGWTVPILRGGQMQPQVIGDDDRSFDGTIMRDRRAVKRRWTFGTSTIDRQNAEALINTVLGRGDNWPYDSDLYSHKGLGVASSSVGSIRPGKAAVGGDDILDESTGIEESKFGDGSLAVEDAVTNLLPADSRDAENAPTGYSAVVVVSSSLQANSAVAVQGTKSVTAVTGGTGDGLETGAITPSVSTDYAASVYVWASSAFAMNLVWWDVGAANPFKTTGFNTVANKWVRVTDTFTTPGSGFTDMTLRVLNNAGAAKNFACDAFQIEQNDHVTTWADPSRASGDLEYNPSLLTVADSMTFAAWLRSPTANPSSVSMAMRAYEASTVNDVLFRRDASANNATLRVYDADGNTDSLTYGTSPWDDDWHHVAFTLRGADNQAVIYYDGSSVASKTMAYYPRLAELASLFIGNTGGSSYWDGLIDDLMLLPFAAPAELIAAIAAQTVAHAPLPKIRASGDFYETYPAGSGEDYGVLVEGSVRSSDYNPVAISGSWTNNAQRVAFELET
jgi:hypothetical protein